MAKSIRNSIFRTRELQGDSKFPCRHEIQLGQQMISQSIFTYLSPQENLENFANKNREMPDRSPEGTKLRNSSRYVSSLHDI